MPSSEVMHKFKEGLLHSGSKSGKVVKDRKQAIAIMLSEKRDEDEGKGHGVGPSKSLRKKHKIG